MRLIIEDIHGPNIVDDPDDPILRKYKKEGSSGYELKIKHAIMSSNLSRFLSDRDIGDVFHAFSILLDTETIKNDKEAIVKFKQIIQDKVHNNADNYIENKQIYLDIKRLKNEIKEAEASGDNEKIEDAKDKLAKTMTRRSAGRIVKIHNYLENLEDNINEIINEEDIINYVNSRKGYISKDPITKKPIRKRDIDISKGGYVDVVQQETDAEFYKKWSEKLNEYFDGLIEEYNNANVTFKINNQKIILNILEDYHLLDTLYPGLIDGKTRTPLADRISRQFSENNEDLNKYISKFNDITDIEGLDSDISINSNDINYNEFISNANDRIKYFIRWVVEKSEPGSADKSNLIIKRIHKFLAEQNHKIEKLNEEELNKQLYQKINNIKAKSKDIANNILEEIASSDQINKLSPGINAFCSLAVNVQLIKHGFDFDVPNESNPSADIGNIRLLSPKDVTQNRKPYFKWNKKIPARLQLFKGSERLFSKKSRKALDTLTFEDAGINPLDDGNYKLIIIPLDNKFNEEKPREFRFEVKEKSSISNKAYHELNMIRSKINKSTGQDLSISDAYKLIKNNTDDVMAEVTFEYNNIKKYIDNMIEKFKSEGINDESAQIIKRYSILPNFFVNHISMNRDHDIELRKFIPHFDDKPVEVKDKEPKTKDEQRLEELYKTLSSDELNNLIIDLHKERKEAIQNKEGRDVLQSISDKLDVAENFYEANKLSEMYIEAINNKYEIQNRLTHDDYSKVNNISEIDKHIKTIIKSTNGRVVNVGAKTLVNELLKDFNTEDSDLINKIVYYVKEQIPIMSHIITQYDGDPNGLSDFIKDCLIEANTGLAIQSLNRMLPIAINDEKYRSIDLLGNINVISDNKERAIKELIYVVVKTGNEDDIKELFNINQNEESTSVLSNYLGKLPTSIDLRDIRLKFYNKKGHLDKMVSVWSELEKNEEIINAIDNPIWSPSEEDNHSSHIKSFNRLKKKLVGLISDLAAREWMLIRGKPLKGRQTQSTPPERTKRDIGQKLYETLSTIEKEVRGSVDRTSNNSLVKMGLAIGATGGKSYIGDIKTAMPIGEDPGKEKNEIKERIKSTYKKLLEKIKDVNLSATKTDKLTPAEQKSADILDSLFPYVLTIDDGKIVIYSRKRKMSEISVKLNVPDNIIYSAIKDHFKARYMNKVKFGNNYYLDPEEMSDLASFMLSNAFATDLRLKSEKEGLDTKHIGIYGKEVKDRLRSLVAPQYAKNRMVGY